MIRGIVIAIAAILIVDLDSCKKPSDQLQLSVRATINGTPFFGSNCVSTLLGTALFITGGNFSDSTGVPITLPTIGLIIDTHHPPATGTFVIDTVQYKASLDSTTYVYLQAVSGSISLTSISPQITGSFYFTCSDSTKIINGTFTAKHY